MARPPVDLSVNVTDANGTVTRWGSEDTTPDTIPTGLQFRTQRMEGFADASVTLSRRIDRENLDVGLLDDVAFVGTDGSVAYEGRVGGQPRSMDATHSVSIQCAGWMRHLKDRTFREIYVDRDLSRWGDASVARRTQLVASHILEGGHVVRRDPSGTQSLAQELLRLSRITGGVPIMESWYDAQGILLGDVWYDHVQQGITGATDYGVFAALEGDDSFNGALSTQTSDMAGSPSSGYLSVTAGSVRRYVRLLWQYDGPNTDTVGRWFVSWRNPAVYGQHGLTRRGADPGGFYASDVVRNIVSRFAPKVNTTGVLDTTFVIPQLAFLDPITPYDALLQINAYHLWTLGVWENRTLCYGPTDLTDYDWEVRHDDPGVTISLQGDSVDDLANGITVAFTSSTTGQAEYLTPDVYPELRDDGVENPANTHGLKLWTSYSLSIPTTREGALQIGRAALAEFNQPKAPGSITCRFHIRDRAGHWQPVWKVRAGDRIAVTSSTTLSDRPRLIQETSYDHDGKTLTIAVDATAKRLDAVIDRISTALSAANLT